MKLFSKITYKISKNSKKYEYISKMYCVMWYYF